VSVERPHFDFPFRRDPQTGKVAVVEQGSPEHIAACDNVVIRCPIGFRDERPEFGWPFPRMRTIPLDLSQLREALRRFGHSNGGADVSQYTDAVEAAVQHIDLDVGPRNEA
jgi:hypothetical protein